MFKYLALLSYFFIPLLVVSQDCPPTDFVVNTQADLDSFALHYPDCTLFEHNLYIHADDITNVDAFSNLERIEQLEINGTSNLNDLSGFDNLKQIVGTLYIDLNDGLIQVTAFAELLSVGNINVRGNPNLEYFGGFPKLPDAAHFWFIDNPELIEIHGFNKLIAVLGNGIELENLPALKTIPTFDSLRFCRAPFKIMNTGLEHLDGFNRLDSLENLIINQNDFLLDINGFQSVHGINGRLSVALNTQLTTINSFNELHNVQDFYFHGNEALISIGTFPNLVETEDFEFYYHSNLTAIEGFPNLVRTEALFIQGNEGIRSIKGFNNLQSVGGEIGIDDNLLLEQLEGFNKLITVNWQIKIAYNLNLHTLKAFDNLRSCESLIIKLNPITTISDFPNLETIENSLMFSDLSLVQLPSFNSLRVAPIVQVWEMPLLQDISGLNAIDVTSVEDLELKDNPMLSDCSNNFICSILGQQGNPTTVTIANNLPECSDPSAILADCNSQAVINFDVFFDVFENGIHDINENSIGSIEIINEFNFQSYYSSPNGNTKIFLDPGTYTFTVNPDANQWLIDVLSQTITVEAGDNELISFPLTPANYQSEIITHIASPPLRCNEIVKLTVTMTNLGNTVASGRLILDPIFADGNFDFIDEPDTINSDFFGWNFEGLHPGQQQTKCIYFHVPGPPSTAVGTILSFDAYVDYNDITGSHTSDAFAYDEVMRCSYDPNDKLVSPNRDSLENFTLFDEVLHYTIRFQNTGNDYARDIFILDTLDTRLDLESFAVTASSHPNVLTTSRTVGGFVKFDFQNIYLPDSTTDNEGSNGFVSYRILPLAGLNEFTNIENSASIYFDFNPPIHTNTTINQLVDEIYTDNDADGFYSYEDCDDENAAAYPGAMEIVNNGIDEDCNGEDLISSTIEFWSSDLQLFPNPANDRIHWKLNNDVQLIKLRLYTPQGILINEFDNASKFLNLSIIDSGYYLLLFDTTMGKCVKSFVKI